MDRFIQMTVFKAVADSEGFASAARQLGMSPPAVTRAIAALENQLKVKLLNRTTRHVRLTEAGERYLNDVNQILADVKSADESVVGVNAEPSGELVVTAPVMFGQIHVMPIITEYLESYSDTKINALFYDHLGNLLEEGIDVAIRIGELPDSSMRALKVGEVVQMVVASPGYLDKHGIPNEPDELKRHNIVATNTAGYHVNWPFNADQSVRLQPRLKASSNSAAIAAAKQGFGITRVLSYQVADSLKQHELVPLLERFTSQSMPVNIVHREGRFETTKIRSFIDLAAVRLREILA